MSDPSKVDHDLKHLYPDFRAKVEKTLALANSYTFKPDTLEPKFAEFREFVVFEGYRSVDRQAWLYAQGRTRAGNVVTNSQVPGWHGFGLAVDVVWRDTDGKLRWDGEKALWEILGHCARVNGLEWGGDWQGNLGDYGHLQIPKTEIASWRAKAREYLKGIGLGSPI